MEVVWKIIKQYRKLNEKVLNCAAEKIVNQQLVEDKINMKIMKEKIYDPCKQDVLSDKAVKNIEDIKISDKAQKAKSISELSKKDLQ